MREGCLGQRLLQPGDLAVLDRPEPVPGGADLVLEHPQHQRVVARRSGGERPLSVHGRQQSSRYGVGESLRVGTSHSLLIAAKSRTVI